MRCTLLTGLLLVACGDYRRGVEPDAALTNDAGPLDAGPLDAGPLDAAARDARAPDAGSIVFTCTAFCEPTRTRCGAGAHGACVTQCDLKEARTPRSCSDEVDVLFGCTRTATVLCMTGRNIPFVGCDSQYDALIRCIGR